jgi:hypothetical protein
MIVNSIWWDDSQYLIEGLDGDFAVTRVTEDGQGLYVNLDESAAVTASLDDQDGTDVGRVA